MGAIVQMVAAVALALATGWLGGRFVLAPPSSAAPPQDVVEAVPASALPGAERVVELPAITTNLAGADGAWARLELALVFATAPDAAMADRVHADALAYLRSLAVHQIDTPSGLLFLRADLAARAADLTDGAVTAVLVRTFLIE